MKKNTYREIIEQVLGMTKNIVLTGFEPFGGSQINPSIIACKSYENQIISDYEIKVFEIPLRFKEIKNQIEEIVKQEEPKAVICTGQSPRPVISVERVAINVADLVKSAYNCRTKPEDEILDLAGPAAYFTKLPIKLIKSNLEEDKIPCEISNSAGTYGCNQIFYHLMHFINTNNINIPAGFIHVPSLPEQVIGKNYPSMSIETIKRGIGIIINTTIEELTT